MSRVGAACGALVLALALGMAVPWASTAPAEPLAERPGEGWGPARSGDPVFRHGDQIEQIDGSLRATGPASPLVFGQPLDLNTASAAQLQALPGIGPALAERVVLSREEEGPFTELAALERVRGIGPATRAKVEPWLTVTE